MQKSNRQNAGKVGDTSTAAPGKGLATPLIMALGALLIVQLLAAVAMSFSGNDLSPMESQGPLLAFEHEAVTRLQVQVPEKEALVLEKGDGAWRLPSLDGFPAMEIKVEDLLTKLGTIEKRIPVATSEAAIKRFKVAEDAYERRVTLEDADGVLGTIYLGDSPGFRRLFVRAEGEQAVYEADLALFDASEKADDWTQKTALRIAQDDIKRVEIADILLTQEEGEWKFAGLAGNRNLDQDAVSDLIRTLANLSYSGVLGRENNPEYGQDAPVLIYQMTSGEDILEYRLSKLAQSNDHVLKVSNSPFYFRVSEFTAEGLKEAKAADLVAGEELDEIPSESGTPPAEEEPAPGMPEILPPALPEIDTRGDKAPVREGSIGEEPEPPATSEPVE